MLLLFHVFFGAGSGADQLGSAGARRQHAAAQRTATARLVVHQLRLHIYFKETRNKQIQGARFHVVFWEIVRIGPKHKL